MNSWAVPFLLGLEQLALVSGEISLNLFTDPDCGGDGGTLVGGNIQDNPGNPLDNSNCVAQGDFSSINILKADPGFQCNVFNDPQCPLSSLLASFTEVGCTNIIGQAASCFNHALLDNPFAEGNATVSIGRNPVQVVGLGSGDTLQNELNNAVGQACSSGTTCDPTNTLVLKQTFGPTNPACNEGLGDIPAAKAACSSEDCTTTIALSGQFGNGNERDYMKSLMQGTMNVLPSLVSFLAVDVTAPNNDQLANIQVTVTTQCTTVPPPSSFTCDGDLAGAISAVVGAIPEVGGIIAAGFVVSCNAADAAGGGS
ncbi:hypothetical protein NA57DRAFT_51625 [Rhizodiscina lignyota]|uniref:Uncharacterized protein n=1 Tax=Rhizodiscina lignyota TaxID=1504668 RepID=A0A9P4INM9_9PEZI|nr:hypothetical protein NA57DRAFT_51625 [Rhizodiscina lignyota]